MTELDQEIIRDAERFRAIANLERTVATNKWMVQVIGTKNDIHSAYFDKPSAGQPEVMYPSRLDALRACVDSAIESAHNETN